jgi:glycosyltransferase involved in cell wall biosynthesis
MRLASGVVFLSWACFNQWSAGPKLHLDGGVAGLRFDPSRPNDVSVGMKVVLYTGAMNRWGGVDRLVEAFTQVKDRNVELWACGPGRSARLEAALQRDARLKCLGLVPESQLQELCRQASMFVNPRPSAEPGNDVNFPSKVLEYLTFGKPVVSTWTGGLGPEYRDVLLVTEEDTPEALAAKIQEALSWQPWQRRKLATRIAAFLQGRRLWSVQAARLLEWLRSQVLRPVCGSGERI